MPDRKTILVTGASSGIGAAVARELARGRHQLAITARRLDRLEHLADEFEALGAEVLVLPASLEDPDSPEALVAATVDRFDRLDALINVAGFGIPALFGGSDPDEIRRQVEVNFVAPMLLARHALPRLIESRGTVINVGSAITAIPNPIFGAYGATKAGLAWWNNALRRELMGRGVQVCLVEPGPVTSGFFEALQDQVPGATGRILEPPPAFLTARVESAARKIVRLLDHPRRRISPSEWVTWPFRLIGGLFTLWPALGDHLISPMPEKLPPVVEPMVEAQRVRAS
jgi:short-subunit dehydrogenase